MNASPVGNIPLPVRISDWDGPSCRLLYTPLNFLAVPVVLRNGQGSFNVIRTANTFMYCPQCGTESASSLQYCRLCGANLKVIGKAVALSEAIARSDRGPLPKLKELVRNFKIPEQVTDEISGALEKMNEELVRSSGEPRHKPSPWWQLREKQTPERRREEQRVKGTVSFFTGIGLTIFLYNLAGAVVLKLPPDVLAKIPFELEPMIRVLWTVGLIPTLSGAGHLIASLFIKSAPARSQESAAPAPVVLRPGIEVASAVLSEPIPHHSVTEGTTNLLSSD